LYGLAMVIVYGHYTFVNDALFEMTVNIIICRILTTSMLKDTIDTI